MKNSPGFLSVPSAPDARPAAVDPGTRSLLDSLGVIAWEADPVTCRFTRVSGALESLLGYAAADWLSPGFRERLVHPDDRAWVVGRWSQHRLRGEDDELEYRVIAADGRCVWLRELLRAERSERGEPTVLRGVLVDVTREKRAERELREQRDVNTVALAAVESCGRRVARIAHDYNNALTGLLGFADMLVFTLRDQASALSQVQELRAAAERVASLTTELRELAAETARPGSAAPAAAPPAAAPGTPAEAPGSGAPAGGRVVLLVEDEGIVRRLMIQTLRRDGWRVLDAPSGPDALRLVRESGMRLDLLVTDIVMPGMSGREVAERLRRAQPDLPVLFVTGFSSEADPRRLPGRSAALLQKPFLPEALVHQVRELLRACAT